MRRHILLATGLAVLTFGLGACGGSTAPPPASTTTAQATAADIADPPASPKASCGPGDRPEPGLQGRLSQADFDSGLASQGVTCNTELVGSYVTANAVVSVGGWKVRRYVDSAGHECAYYDATDIFPLGLLDNALGVNVLDMADPAHPALVTRLTSLAMLSPHESLVLSESRGLLAAVLGNPAFGPGVVDVYDISQDCRHPVLKSSSPVGFFGHESGMSPDGRTFFSASPFTPTFTAVDISNPSFTLPLWTDPITAHGVSISADGNRAYVADTTGLIRILDIAQIQARKQNPQVTQISTITWAAHSIPQVAIPITIKGKPYLVEVDEFGAGSQVGAARIIDISDEANPVVISNMRLEVHEPQTFTTTQNDPGAGSSSYGGYAAHYCNVPSPVDPPIVACSMILSGLRVFNITDPYHPREVAYFNAPVNHNPFTPSASSNAAYSSPAFAPERKEIWYSDSSSGFYAVRVTNDAWP